MAKTIYLANPYGFSQQQKVTLLPPIVAALESLALEVWEPFARNNQENFAEAGWAYRIGQKDFADVVNCGCHLCRGQRRAARRGSDGGAGHGHRPGQAHVPVP